MKHTVRTFLAVEITPTIRSAAEELIERLQAVDADVKWVEPENLHLTLKFLGEVTTRDVAHVCQAAQRATAELAPFELDVHGAGAFPDARRPRTLWLGTAAGEQEMVTLHDKIEKPLAKLGYRAERRRFHPHLTIGRVRRGGPGVTELGELLQQHADFDAGRVTVKEVVVFSSQLERTGPVYEVLGRAKLKG